MTVNADPEVAAHAPDRTGRSAPAGVPPRRRPAGARPAVAR
ncbi:hypothetical protein QNO07_00525 [Streptomyces sp. 549]|nr:hypothetical protein [Streptomyces sp. 549]MDK1471924.1 hypothetical protein [Streptomyces sp. 549]